MFDVVLFGGESFVVESVFIRFFFVLFVGCVVVGRWG